MDDFDDFDNFDDLDEYNGNVRHDMWVDYDYNQHTGELPYADDNSYADDPHGDVGHDPWINYRSDENVGKLQRHRQRFGRRRACRTE